MGSEMCIRDRHCDIQSSKVARLITDLAYNGSQRLAMSQAGHFLLDGFGYERVINSMEEQ